MTTDVFVWQAVDAADDTAVYGGAVYNTREEASVVALRFLADRLADEMPGVNLVADNAEKLRNLLEPWELNEQPIGAQDVEVTVAAAAFTTPFVTAKLPPSWLLELDVIDQAVIVKPLLLWRATPLVSQYNPLDPGGWHVVYHDPQPRKIHAIKAIRSVVPIGLKESKTCADKSPPLITGLDEDMAFRLRDELLVKLPGCAVFTRNSESADQWSQWEIVSGSIARVATMSSLPIYTPPKAYSLVSTGTSASAWGVPTPGSSTSTIGKPGRVRMYGHYEGTSDKILLIKEVRAITGWGLKEAKDLVDATSYVPAGSTTTKFDMTVPAPAWISIGHHAAMARPTLPVNFDLLP